MGYRYGYVIGNEGFGGGTDDDCDSEMSDDELFFSLNFEKQRLFYNHLKEDSPVRKYSITRVFKPEFDALHPHLPARRR